MNRLLSSVGSHAIAWILRRPEMAPLYEIALRRHSLRMLLPEIAARISYELQTEFCIPSKKVRFEVASACNLRCALCPQHSLMRRKKQLMNFRLYESVLQNNTHIRMVELWNWGEPLLHPRIGDFVRSASCRGIRSSLSTNGTLLTEDQARDLISAGLDEIIFSIDNIGYTFEKLRMTPFEPVRQKVLRFITLARQSRPRMRIAIYMVESPQSQEGLDAAAASLRALGADQIIIAPWGLREISNPTTIRAEPCREWYHDIVVLSDGSVVPCCADFDGTLTFGNVGVEPNLKRLFNSSRARAYRRGMRSPNTMPPRCRVCTEFTKRASPPRFL